MSLERVRALIIPAIGLLCLGSVVVQASPPGAPPHEQSQTHTTEEADDKEETEILSFEDPPEFKGADETPPLDTLSDFTVVEKDAVQAPQSSKEEGEEDDLDDPLEAIAKPQDTKKAETEESPKSNSTVDVSNAPDLPDVDPNADLHGQVQTTNTIPEAHPTERSSDLLNRPQTMRVGGESPYQEVILKAQDKVTGRVSTVHAPVDEVVNFERLRIVCRYCDKAPPEATPEVKAFLEIYETHPLRSGEELIFSGWMFASNPASSAMANPVYEVWVDDALKQATQSRSSANTEEEFSLHPSEKQTEELEEEEAASP